MRKLSISRAWDETKAILSRDGKLFASVALALITFPTLITGYLNPKGMTDASPPLWASIVTLIASLVVFGGQLACIRLALGPSITVGSAIGHGMRRMPIYFLAILIVVAGLLLAAVPFALALSAAGVPMTGTTLPNTPPVVIAVILYFALICFIFVRMCMTAPAASGEAIGAIAIIRRSWELTAGNFWRLLGFLLLFLVATMLIVLALHSAIGLVVSLALGPVEPMSASAVVIALIDALINAVVTVLLTVMLARMYVQVAGHAGTESGVPISGT